MPDILWKSEENRLTTNMISITYDNLPEDPEVKKTSCYPKYTKESSLAKAFEYFSNWHYAKIAVKICLCYRKKILERNKAKKSEVNVDLKTEMKESLVIANV